MQKIPKRLRAHNDNAWVDCEVPQLSAAGPRACRMFGHQLLWYVRNPDAQRHRESARPRIALCKSRKRATAQKAREQTLHMTRPNASAAMLRAAQDLEFLAQFEVRPRRSCL
jgi:hypothetical protein